MGRLSEYDEEGQDAILGFGPKDTIEYVIFEEEKEFTPEEESEFLIMDGLSQLGIEAAEHGFEDLSSALADLEFLFIVGYGRSIAERLQAVSNEIRITMLAA